MKATICKKGILVASMWLTIVALIISCNKTITTTSEKSSLDNVAYTMETKSTSSSLPFLKGADLSYVNELQDGGVIFTENGVSKDPYVLMNNYGANAVRLRLWHNPTWTNYSNLADVKRSIARAKNLNMRVLLDFHYSDTWTDPEQSLVPAAWASVVNNTSVLADSIYNYTTKVLTELKNSNLLPDLVQIGNETNNNFLVSDNTQLLPVNVTRNVTLFNAGLDAVADFNLAYSKNIKTVLHVAMTINDASNWVYNLDQNGIMDYDMLGMSYYPQWQSYTPEELGTFTATLLRDYNIQLLVAETGHIWTREWNDESHNLMSNMGPGYPETPCPQLQKDFLIEVKNAVRDNGGAGVFVWEPAWVSSDIETLWGVGSNWENVAFFDFNNELLDHGGIEFFSENNVEVTFRVDMSGAGKNRKGYITGAFTSDNYGSWQIIPMEQEGTSNIYRFTTHLTQGQTGAYYYLRDSTWTARETVPAACQIYWNSDRGYSVSTSSTSQTISNVWSSCASIQ